MQTDKNNQEDKVYDFQFPSFTETPVNTNITDFTFEPIEKVSIEDLESIQKKIRLERTFAEKSNFKISPIVKEHRGLNAQEHDEREKKFLDEVNRRVAEIEAQAYEKGMAEGRKAGQEEVYNETRAAVEEKIISFTEMVNYVLQTQEEIINQQKSEIYLLLKNLTKWIILRELKDDGQYIERLLTRLVQEMQTKSNLLIKVNKNAFKGMDEVLESVEESLGKLNNVRVEIDFESAENGLIVEADNGIIDATMEEQLSKLDDIFKVVGTDG